MSYRGWFGSSSLGEEGVAVDVEGAGFLFAGGAAERVARVTDSCGGHIASGASPIRRLTMIGRFLAGGSKEVEASMASHCETSGELSLRLGLGPAVRDPLQQAFERWDGKGSPAKLAGVEIARIMRIVHIANDVEALHRIGGVDAAVEMLRSRRGTEFDPDLVDHFCAHAGDLLASLDEHDGWDTLIARHDTLGRRLNGDELDQALGAFADYADVKSPFMLGHSRGVAQLATAAAATVGLPGGEVVLVRRAALVHDVGTIGVSAGILDKTGRLTENERERIRTHPYLTARTYSKPRALAAIGMLAAMHHERMDGSGYPSGLTADALPMTARVIAAADVYHALLEPRPHRGAFTRETAAQILATEVTEGRLDGDAVKAVLDAAGHRVGRQAGQAGGLTAREVEILVMVSRGMTKKQIAKQLTISAKTVSAHVEHVYTKLGVTSRGAAALFAMRHGLVAVREFDAVAKEHPHR